MILELVSLYKLSFVVVALSSALLFVIGTHLIPRQEAVAVFTFSKLALVGHLVGSLLIHEQYHIYLYFFSLVFYIGGKELFLHYTKRKDKKTSLFIGLYIIFWSISNLLVSYFPGLDSHMTAGVFGDVVTSTFNENVIIICSALAFGLFYFSKRKSFHFDTLEISLFKTAKFNKTHEVIMSFILVLFLFKLGIIFTLGYLLIPSILLVSKMGSQRNLLIIGSIFSALSSSLGLFLSLYFSRLSTVPTQIVLLVIITAGFSLVLPKRQS